MTKPASRVESRDRHPDDPARLVSDPVSPISRRPARTSIAVIALLGASWLSFPWTMGEPDSGHQDSASAAGIAGQDATDRLRLQIRLNSADERELSLVPSVGPVLARRIVADRADRGPFRSLSDLGRVQGIGPKTLQQLAIYCVVQGPEAQVASSR